MKKASARKSKADAIHQLRDEYRFDYSKATPNRFASRVDRSRLVVALDPDVSAVFTTSDAVNFLLEVQAGSVVYTAATPEKAVVLRVVSPLAFEAAFREQPMLFSAALPAA